MHIQLQNRPGLSAHRAHPAAGGTPGQAPAVENRRSAIAVIYIYVKRAADLLYLV